MTGLILALSSFALGYYARRIYGFCRTIYWHQKLGICWRYKPTGWIENRNGTLSDYCRRCGHPGGYHYSNQ